MSRNQKQNRLRKQNRKASLLVAVVVCLVIVSSICLGMITSSLREHRNLKLHHQMRQTQLMVDSGFQKAIHAIKDDASYEGENWEPTLPWFEGKIKVVIQVLPDQCIVEATLDPKHGQITRHSDHFQLP